MTWTPPRSEQAKANQMAGKALDVDASAIRARYESGAPSSAVANEFGISVATVRRLVRKAGGLTRPPGCPPGLKLPPRSPCPSTAAYKRGCRCDGCTEAEAEAMKQYRAAARALGPAQHGSAKGYTYYGCRCDDCRTAARERRRTA